MHRHYRTLRRMLQVAVERRDRPRSAEGVRLHMQPNLGSNGQNSAFRSRVGLHRARSWVASKQKILANPCDRVASPHVPKTDMTFLGWEQVYRLAEAHSERHRAMIYLAVNSGMRWSELIGLRRARLDLRTRKVRVTEQLIRLDDGA